MKKILFVLFAALTAVFILTFSVSAVCTHENKENVEIVYQDYAASGELKFTCPSCAVTSVELDPLAEFLGYSVSQNGSDMCSGYKINQEALSEILKVNSSFEIGLVAASKALLGDKMPLDSKTGKAVDLSEYDAHVIKVNLNNYECPLADVVIKGFDKESYLEQIYMSLYTFDGNTVKYIQKETSEAIKETNFVEAYRAEDIVVNNVHYSVYVPQTTVAPHRQMQMNNSKADFNTGSSYTDAELNEVVKGTNLITNFFTSLLFPNASAFMKHYLKASGNDYTINMSSSGFFDSSDTKTHRNTRITDAMRAAEQVAIEDVAVTLYQKTEQVNHFSDTKDDWYLSVGSYFTCIQMQDITLTVDENGVKTYSASVVYNVTDFYNWDESKTWDVNSILTISECDLHNLHKAGRAKEFCSSGTATYNITWTEGQSFSDVY